MHPSHAPPGSATYGYEQGTKNTHKFYYRQFQCSSHMHLWALQVVE